MPQAVLQTSNQEPAKDLARGPPKAATDQQLQVGEKLQRMTEKMEQLLTKQEAAARKQMTQDHAKTMVDTIWQKVQQAVQPIKIKQAELEQRVTLLEEEEEKPIHATTQLIRLTDKHDPANKQVTVMYQVTQQTIDQKLQAIKDLVRDMNYEAVDIHHFNKSDRNG